MSEASATSRGDFFAVDRAVWAKACDSGLNPAVAFLVLARFSGRDNVTTSASVHAVETYTSVSRARSIAAIECLIKNGSVKKTRGGSAPRYRLTLDAKGESIWLPNALVTGTGGEVPPLERVRQTQDPMTMRLLVDLYHQQNLRENGGVDRGLVRKPYERRRIGERAQYVVYGFEDTGSWTVFWRAGVTDVHWNSKPPKGANEAVDFFRRFGQLQDLGLVEWVPHLFESEDKDSEIIHPYGIGGSDDLANRLGDAANRAARALLTEGQCEMADERALWLVPVPRHIAQVAMVGVARLRYRPRTSLTAAWWADYQSKADGYLTRYEKIATTAVPASSRGYLREDSCA